MDECDAPSKATGIDTLNIVRKNEIQCIPNPTNSNFILAIQIDSNQTQSGIIDIYNILGIKIFEQNISLINGLYQENITEDWPQGLYIVEARIGNNSFKGKLTIQR